MSDSVHFPSIFIPPIQGPADNPPLEGRVERIHRRPGHYAKAGEPVVDISIGSQILRLCAVEEGKVMRCREVGEVVKAGDEVIEITSVGTATWEVFVAYRRSDSPGHAGRISERLISEFGPGQVFRDIESLSKGRDYIKEIEQRLQTAEVMVVVIGPHWLDERLNDPGDLHRKEIKTSLDRGIHVQPLLVGGAHMPGKDDLPVDIGTLANMNAIEVSDTRWDYDMGCVSETIERTLANSPRRKAFLRQVPPWTPGPRLQFVQDNPPLDESS